MRLVAARLLPSSYGLLRADLTPRLMPVNAKPYSPWYPPTMTRLISVTITNYRSAADAVTIQFPRDMPVVLIGENNCGKSNLVRAIDLLLGTSWPGNHDPEDNEFHGRDRTKVISIRASFDPDAPLGGYHTGLRWTYDQAQDPPVYYKATPGAGGYADSWVSNAIRGTCTCVVIEAERNLKYHLSYASKWTLLSRLMHRFHKAMLEDEVNRAQLLVLFDQIKARFEAIQSFADFKSILSERLSEFSQAMTHRLDVDFEAYNPVNFFHALRLHAAEGDDRRTLEEMGTGEQQILALSFAYAYATTFHEGVFLVIEEPEAHLHPLAQQWLASRLSTMCASGLQVLITTHSPHFIDVMALPGLVLVRKTGSATVLTQLSTADLRAECIRRGAPTSRTTEGNLLPFYQANASTEILEGFFAKAVVLVEGKTESISLPELLRRCGLEHTQAGIAIIPVHGKGNLAKWFRIFEAYGIPTFLMFDNDGTHDGEGTQRKDALAAVGIPADQIDGQLAGDGWTVNARHCIFGADYETTLRQALPGYQAAEEAARTAGVSAKPFVARWAMEHIPPPDASAGWQTAHALTAAVRALIDRPD